MRAVRRHERRGGLDRLAVDGALGLYAGLTLLLFLEFCLRLLQRGVGVSLRAAHGVRQYRTGDHTSVAAFSLYGSR